jgi:hypothetical protein
MDPITEFAALNGVVYSASTRRVYLSAAKKAIKLVVQASDKCDSYQELLELLCDGVAHERIPKKLRIAPFLSFLKSKLPGFAVEESDYEWIRTWVRDRIGTETRAVIKASHYVRRDLAMLACLCVAPGKGSPRYWPKKALVATRQNGGGFKVRLWEKEVEAHGLALALLYWHTWRTRLDRPEQSRIYSLAWVSSDLLFPNAMGGTLTKHALRNALLRLGGDAPAGLTPGMIQRAFMQVEG